MKHVLDNPAWNALVSGNKHLSYGDGNARFFDKDVSPFVALMENNTENFGTLYEQLRHSSPVLFVAPVEIEIPAPWKTLQFIKGLQMVWDIEKELDERPTELTALTDEHIPQMMALAKLTNPGPFASNTISFGHYQGIFENQKLAAMAGQRLHAFEYAEISAVCTHPDNTGKGYARLLLLSQVNRIKAASGIPFLHVRDDNERAIKVYKQLGFATRTRVYFYVLVKSGN